MNAVELAQLIADVLDPRDDIASATPMVDDEEGSELVVVTQGGTEFMVQVLPYTSK